MVKAVQQMTPREYRTYFHIGTSWGVSESSIGRIVQKIERKLIESGEFRLRGKKVLLKGAEKPEIAVMDVTETAIELLERNKNSFILGRKKIIR